MHDSALKTFFGRVAATAGTNLFIMAAAGGAGLYLASQLGAVGRGRFAAIQSWFGILTIIGEFGLTSSACFHIASNPKAAADWLTTCRNMLFVLGVATATVGLSLSVVLANATAAPLMAFAFAFLTMPIMFLAGAWTFALQAISTRRWNYARMANPVLYCGGILALGFLDRLSVISATVVLGFAVVIQSVIAQRLCRGTVGRGRAHRSMVRPLLRYGLSSFTGSVPYAFNARLDQVLLTLLVGNAELGNYAVAVSLTLLASPLSASFGSVLMPALARGDRENDGRLVRSAMRGTVMVGLGVVTPVAVCVPFLATRLLGPSYVDVPILVALLAPGAVILGCNQVLGDILRGRGRPLDVGRCELVGLVATGALLSALVPPLGARGAAIASTMAYAVSFVLLWRRATSDARCFVGPAKSQSEDLH